MIGVLTNSKIHSLTVMQPGVASLFSGMGVSTYLDGAPDNAGYISPFGICASSSGLLFITDSNLIRYITTAGNSQMRYGNDMILILDAKIQI